MPEKIERIEEREKTSRESTTRAAEQTATILQEVEQSLLALRQDLSVLAGRVGPLAPAGPFPTLWAGGPESAGSIMALTPGAPAFPLYGGGYLSIAGPEALSYASRTPAVPVWGSTPGGGSGGPGNGSGLVREFKNLPPTSRVPSVDLIDEGQAYVIKVALPGVRKEDVDILVSGRNLVINAQCKIDAEEGTVVLSECGSVVYRRTIALPSEIHTTQTRATLKDGLLTVKLAKKVPGESPRRVDVAYG